MSIRVATAVTGLLADRFQGSPLKVGLVLRGNRTVAEHVVELGHNVLVVCDRFPPLFRVFKKVGSTVNSRNSIKTLLVEARFDAMPVRRRSLDVLVLTSGLPPGQSPRVTLARLRALLRPGGLFIWPQPISDGRRGLFSRVIAPSRRESMTRVRRQDLCALAMEAGFSDVGQTLVKKKLLPWVVTTGSVRKRPWENAS